MASIFDMPRASEKTIVVRTLTNVHAAIDRHLPQAPSTSHRFSDTLFDAPEQTKIVMSPEVETAQNVPPQHETSHDAEATRQNTNSNSPDMRLVVIALVMLIAAIILALMA